MTPSSFTFKLSVPREPALAALVAEVVAHACAYAEMHDAVRESLAGEVAKAAAQELGVGDGESCPIVMVAADGTLTVTIGGHTVSQKISG